MPRKAKAQKESPIVSAPDEPIQIPTTDPIEQPSSSQNIFNSDGELVVDVFETHSDFVVMATIAGVQIKDLDISVEKDMMIIKGDRSDPHNDGQKKYFYQECYFGPFSRKIVLPENIHTEKASAEM